jgi:hypothetical protein
MVKQADSFIQNNVCFYLLGALAFYSLSSTVLQSQMGQIEKDDGTNKVRV